MGKQGKPGAKRPTGILCRRCGSEMGRVTDTRLGDDSVRRRRECPRCGWRGTSREELIFTEKHYIQ